MRKKRVSLFVRLPSKFCKNLAAPSKEQLAAALGWSLPPEKELGYPRVCKEKEIKCVCVRKCERERERERQACKECKERPPGLIFGRQNFLTSDVGSAVPHQRGTERSFSRTRERKAKKKKYFHSGKAPILRSIVGGKKIRLVARHSSAANQSAPRARHPS